jgi:tetratricopeptide (TPR) repeat protein
LPEIVVPGTGISFRPFIRYIKSEFSPYKPKIVSGELFVDNDFLYLTTRVLGSPEKTFASVKKENLMKVPDSNKIGDFDNLMLQAAIHIYRYTQPYILASYYYSLKKPDDAMEIVKEIVRDKNNANKVWAYNLWGVMLADQKKYDEAIKMFNIALDEDSESVLVYNNLGNVYSDEGDYNEAKKYYEKAIDLDPQYSPSYNNLGIVYSDEGHYNEAKESYEKAIDLDPQYTLAYNNLGNVYSNVDYDKRDGSKAKEYYEKALDLDPQYSYAYNNLGNVYSAEGDYSKAKELYNKAIELDSTYSNAYYSLGNVYSAEKDYSKAKDMYEKVIEVDPDGFGKQAREKIENLPN